MIYNHCCYVFVKTFVLLCSCIQCQLVNVFSLCACILTQAQRLWVECSTQDVVLPNNVCLFIKEKEGAIEKDNVACSNKHI